MKEGNKEGNVPTSADFHNMNLETCPLKLDSTIYIAGHRGLVGSALLRNLQAKGYKAMDYRD